MSLNENPTLYDLLELTPDAPQTEIRAAYLRAKAAFKKDSIALYTLISQEETEELLHRIEEAFQTLSNPDRRREYDRSHGLLAMEEADFARTRAPRDRKIVSIDRVPPMESDGEIDILVPPTTDFTSGPRRSQPQLGVFEAVASDGFPFATAVPAPPPMQPMSQPMSQPLPQPERAPPSLPPEGPVTQTRIRSEAAADQLLDQEIAQEVEWRGTFLRRVRDGRRVSIEEISDFTKITKSYILAIEDENFAKLPAPVYLRGFVTQIAKFLRLPADKVSAAYLVRYHQAKAGR